MPLDIVVGSQWGDEGKGRIVDLLAEKADYVARYNGGDNAGHSVTVGQELYKLHLIPSGIIHPRTINVMGAGMVINPVTLIKEMETLSAAGVDVSPKRLRISYAAHIITPGHSALDAAKEKALGKDSIGTTGRGIGPCYTDRAARTGIRIAEMLDLMDFRVRVRKHTEMVNQQLIGLYHAPALNADQVADQYVAIAEKMVDYIDDPGRLLHQALRDGKRVLAEGAQGALLDLDYGTYPYVTSSNPTSVGALSGLGLGLVPVERVIGVAKAFQTRVGSGPFPTEVFGEAAERLRGSGANPWDEFGTTTGRPRRVGWLDGVLLRYAVRINGLKELILTKLDILSGLPFVRICVGYRYNDEEIDDLPFGPADLSPFEPIYEELPGWKKDLTSVRRWADLPREAQDFVHRIEEVSDIPVSQVSVGPERLQVLDVMR